MPKVSISEAARLTGKSRTTLHRLIRTGELSTCHGDRNARLIDVSELLRVFGALKNAPVEQLSEHVTEQRVTVSGQDDEQVLLQLRQEVEHLKSLVSAQESHISSLKQAMLLLEHRQPAAVTTARANVPWWKFWQR